MSGRSAPASPRGIRLSDSLRRSIEAEAAIRGRSWSAMASELLEEAVRTRRAPGIAFADGASGRRAVVAGTGLDVWELVASWKASGGDFASLRAGYDWLTPMQINAALGYYSLYPEEIDLRLEREASWTEERVREELPFLTPRPSVP